MSKWLSVEEAEKVYSLRSASDRECLFELVITGNIAAQMPGDTHPLGLGSIETLLILYRQNQALQGTFAALPGPMLLSGKDLADCLELQPLKRRRGRPVGAGKHAEKDRELMPQMHHMITSEGYSRKGAARFLAPLAKPGASLQSTEMRLLHKYRYRYGAI